MITRISKLTLGLAILLVASAVDAGPGTSVQGMDDPVCETPYYIDDGGSLLVNPGNVIDCDAERIQSAIDMADAGSTVKLYGRFNLGTELPFINQSGNQTWQPDYEDAGGGRMDNAPNPAFWGHPRGTVFVTKDIEIRGMNGAMIVGGYAPLAVGLQPRLFEYTSYDLDFWFIGGVAQFSPVRIVVKNLSFVEPAFAGIAVFATSGASLVNNHFSEMQLVPSRIFVPYAPGIFVDGGIADAAAYPDLGADYFYQPGELIHGDIRIVGNSVDGDWGFDPDGVENTNYGGLPISGCNTGIHIWYANAEIDVKDNSIARCWDGVRASQQWGTTRIRGNVVEQPADLPGAAISANSATTWTAHAYPYFEEGRSVITDNYLTLNAGGGGIFGTYQDGLVIAGNMLSGTGVGGIIHWVGIGAEIRDNEIHLSDLAWGAISLEDYAFAASVRGNTISGGGRAAIRLGWPFAPTEFNTVEGNDMRDFAPEARMDFFGVTTIGSHVELLWGAAENTIKNNHYSSVDPGDGTLQNIYFAGAIPPFGLPGATGNVVREPQPLKVMDFTDPNGPLHVPATYAGANDIKLGD